MSKKMAPEIRFKGFTQDWEQRKLKDITLKIGSGKTPKGGSTVYAESGIPLVRSQNIHSNKVNFNDVVYITEDINKHMLNSSVLKDDVLLNITGASIGRSAVYTADTPANVNQHVCIIRPNQEVNSFFIQLNIVSTNGQREIELNQASGGREGLNFQQISKMTFSYPSIEEQVVIGAFFKKLDETIALHQYKLEKLKQLKQGYLQVMFPQKGEKVPRLRFVNFYKDWDKRKLGEELSLLKDGTHGTHTDVEDGPYLLSAKNIKNGKVNITETDRKISKEEFTKIHQNFSLQTGDVLLTIVGSIGETAILKETFNITFQRSVAYLRPSHLNHQFLYTVVSGQSFKKELKNRQVVSAQPGIYLGDLAKINILIAPDINEQIKTGNFFKEIDEIIYLHQTKLSKLQEIKNAYLKKMFV